MAERLVRALDRAPGTFVTLIDADMTSRWLSRSATWITGTDPDTRPGRDSLERVHPDDIPRIVHGMSQLRAAQPPGGSGAVIAEPLRYRLKRPDGSWITVESLVQNLLDDPVVNGLLVIGRPVGGELDGVGHVVDLLVGDAPLTEVLAACANLVPHYLGDAAVVGLVDEEPVVGARPGTAAEDLVTDERWYQPALTEGERRASTGFAGFPDDLAERARAHGFRSAWTFPLVEATTGDLIGCVVVWVRLDVELNVATEEGIKQAARLATLVIGEQRRHQALRTAAMTDPLTGLGNRAALRRRLDATGPAGAVTVALIDLDGFKPVNDTYGHDIGDGVLRVVAERILGTVREEDCVVRFGGDEFAIVFADGTAPDGVVRSTERVAAAIEGPIKLGTTGMVTVGASIGLATAAPGDVMSLADGALYRVKREKRLRPSRHAPGHEATAGGDGTVVTGGGDGTGGAGVAARGHADDH